MASCTGWRIAIWLENVPATRSRRRRLSTKRTCASSIRVGFDGRTARTFLPSAQLMRRILVDVARARAKLKRGGDAIQVSLDEAMDMPREPGPDLIALDDALTMLAAFDERKSKVVELRYFGGMSVDETAEVLGVSAMTVMRDWGLAKAWLLRELEQK
jgi:RNA polymerase sigma factor (TIGR02999 family)